MDRLVQAALVGTRRQLPKLEHPALPALESPEETLLAAAAALALSSLAGKQPALWQGRPDPCPPEELPPAGDRALRRLTEGGLRDLWPEWLALTARAGRRCPERWLPELLELGRRNRELRDGIARVSGQRGLWLARRNPDWAYLTADSGALEVWETGGRVLRQDWLERLRRQSPSEALALLEAVWDSEPAEARQGFLEALVTGLSPADEPFLERALTDRSRGVRAAAAELLSRFDSRFRRSLPEGIGSECPDYLDPKPPRGVGQKAWWLQQLTALRALPPVSALSQPSEWKDALLAGWATACSRQARPDWAEALLDRQPEVFSVIPPERREQLLFTRLPSFPLGLLLAHQHPLGAPFSRAFVHRLRDRVQTELSDFELARNLPELGRWLDPSVADAVSALHPSQAWRDSVDRLASVLSFRQAMRAELLRPAPEGRPGPLPNTPR